MFESRPDVVFCICSVWFRQGSEPVLQGHRPDGRVATHHLCGRLPGTVLKHCLVHLEVIGPLVIETCRNNVIKLCWSIIRLYGPFEHIFLVDLVEDV